MSTFPTSLTAEPHPPLDPATVALHRARTAGEAAETWIRRLAERQASSLHGRALHRTADAVAQATHREVVPGGNGCLTEELRHRLSADALLGDLTVQSRPQFAAGERLALAAVCAIAAAMPGTVLGDVARDLSALADDLQAAALAGATASEAADARALPANPRRADLGLNHTDPLQRLAQSGVHATAVEAFETALHLQSSGHGPQARSEALHNALAAAAPGVVAAALFHLAYDLALGLAPEQRLYLHEVAAELDLRVVEDLSGATSDDFQAAKPL
ncbi:hypothetical protein [Kitasatospora sp. NPDC088783]|uniref:hypothetical protein n=1 Tax=Kitasatospora sp. NPDC088783 TaxID=3364077 RepID=UPI003812B7AD